MINRINLRLVRSAVTALAMLVLLSGSSNSLAQKQERKFTPGEMVETGGGMFAKILRCRGAGETEECEIQYYRGDALESTPRWENAYFLRQAEQRVLEYQKRQAGEPENQNRDRGQPDRADEVGKNKNEEPATDQTACSFIAPAGDTSRTAKASELLFKRKIYDIYHVLANGTGSAPLNVGVTFINFQMNKPFINVVRVDPGRGALRINDAAPPNATIYPVRSAHVVCEQYRDATLRRRVENKYACFKNRDGEWVCGADGIPKTTQLN